VLQVKLASASLILGYNFLRLTVNAPKAEFLVHNVCERSAASISVILAITGEKESTLLKYFSLVYDQDKQST